MVAALLLVGGLTAWSSRAALDELDPVPPVDDTARPAPLWDDAGGEPLFDGVVGLTPGATVERCIHLGYGGADEAGPVRVYAPGGSRGELDRYLDLTVEVGPYNDDPFRSCATFRPSAVLYTGTVAGFASEHPRYADGLTTWTPTSGSARTVRFAITVQHDPEVSGLTGGLDLRFEVRRAD